MPNLPDHLDPARGHLDEVPYLLLPYQQRWVADTSPVKIIEKSRRIGLSWAEAADAALHASSQAGADVFYMSYAQDMTKTFIQDVAFWAKQYDLAAGEVDEFVIDDEGKDVQVYQIKFSSGHVVQALSSSPRQLRSKGKPKQRVILDEFAFVDEPDELLKAAMAFLMWGGAVRILSTHGGTENPFNRLIEDVRAKRKPYSLHRVTLDDALADGFYKRICLVTGKAWTPEAEDVWRDNLVKFYGDGADEELFCKPTRSGTKYLSRAVVEQCMDADIPVLHLALKDTFAVLPEHERERQIADWCQENLAPLLSALDPGLKSYFGQDFARSGDLSVIMPAQEEANLVRRTAFVLELRNVPYEAQKQLVFFICDRLPRFMSAAFDATGNGEYLSEVAFQRYGNRVHRVKINGTWYLENFPRYKAGLEAAQVLLPLDSEVLDDHLDVVFKNGIPLVPAGKTRNGARGKRHGDAAIAGVLMYFASLNAGGVIEYGSTGLRETTRVLGDYLQGNGRGHMDRERSSETTERGWGTVAGTTNLNGYH